MEVSFLLSRKQGNSFEQKEVPEKLKEVLQLQPMPAGCFAVRHSDDQPETVSSIESVLFVALCIFENVPGVTECYGVADSITGIIEWRESNRIAIYFYGPYKQTCELIGETPKPFLEWYHSQRLGHCDFNLPVASLTKP